MEAQPSTSGTAAIGTASNSNTSSSRPLTRLRVESCSDDYPEPIATATWHQNVPNGWVATLAADVEEQKKIVRKIDLQIVYEKEE